LSANEPIQSEAEQISANVQLAEPVDRLEAASETEEPSRRIQIMAGLLISLFTVILFLGILELVGFIWERNTAQDSLGWTLVASRRMPIERHGSAESPYYLFETGKSYNWEGIPVEINSRGFRGEEFAVPKPPETFRILNVGDSVAFGWEVNYEESYGQQLETMLNEANDNMQYEVINAGIPGWNVAMARDFLLQEGLSYRRISELTGASTTTVTRIAHWCKHGEGGYRTMLQRNRKKKL